MHNILFAIRSGKNNKVLYFTKSLLRELLPQFYNECLGKQYLSRLYSHPQYEYLKQRIDYYCKLSSPTPLPPTCYRLKDYKMPKKAKSYYFDSKEVFRFFDRHMQWNFMPGDIVTVPDLPTIVKSRPIDCDNTNSVVLKLDKIRHFLFVDDHLPFLQKIPKSFFVGKITNKPNRINFLQQWFDKPTVCDCGIVDDNNLFPASWYVRKKSLSEQLQYRYILALEGNDVASNLKWVMSSNSIAIMPHPTCETWFMEGTLIPNYHYIEIKSDFSDLEDKIYYYNTHIAEAQEIINNAHKYVLPFQNVQMEKLISLGVMDKYLKLVNK